MPIRINFNDVYTDIKTLAEMVGENTYDAMIAISGGGLIPARLLRTHLKIPVYSVCVVSYDENDTKTDNYDVLQWLSERELKGLRGKRVLVVDDLDDTRGTLVFITNKLMKDGLDNIGVAVLYNKMKDKDGELSPDVRYYNAVDIEDKWIVFPWDEPELFN